MTEALYKILTELKLSNRLKAIEILQKHNAGLPQNIMTFLEEIRERDKKKE